MHTHGFTHTQLPFTSQLYTGETHPHGISFWIYKYERGKPKDEGLQTSEEDLGLMVLMQRGAQTHPF